MLYFKFSRGFWAPAHAESAPTPIERKNLSPPLDLFLNTLLCTLQIYFFQQSLEKAVVESSEVEEATGSEVEAVRSSMEATEAMDEADM